MVGRKTVLKHMWLLVSWAIARCGRRNHELCKVWYRHVIRVHSSRRYQTAIAIWSLEGIVQFCEWVRVCLIVRR